MKPDALIPKVGVVTDIRQDTPDVKTFRVVGTDGKKLFEHMPGQCAMVSVPGVGEGMFSITSSPTNEDFMEFSIKKVGVLTDWLHMMDVGQEITVRGPLGKNFPVEQVPTAENDYYGLKGKNLLFIAGGIGLAPLRSVINYCRDKKREDPTSYGSLHIIYGSRSADDLVDYKEILDEWETDCRVDLTIDRPQEGWDGHVGFVPNYVTELQPDLDRAVLICGPPIMIKFTLDGLKKLGFEESQVYTTMELRMKCGIGKCGRCNIGNKYVCKDGPVFRFDELSELPDEY